MDLEIWGGESTWIFLLYQTDETLQRRVHSSPIFVFCFFLCVVVDIKATCTPCPQWVFKKQQDNELSGDIWDHSSLRDTSGLGFSKSSQAVMWFYGTAGSKVDWRAEPCQTRGTMDSSSSDSTALCALFPHANRSWTLGNRASSATCRPPSPPSPWQPRLLLWRPLMRAGMDTIRSASTTFDWKMMCVVVFRKAPSKSVVLNTRNKYSIHTLQYLVWPVGFNPKHLFQYFSHSYNDIWHVQSNCGART